MNFKAHFLVAILLGALLSSCRFGAFNKDYPDSSVFTIKLDGKEAVQYSQSGIITFDLDDESMRSKYLQLELDYYKGGNVVDVGGYSYTSSTLSLEVLGHKSSGIALGNIRTLGSHIINCKSDVDDKFDKFFIINATSAIRELDIAYSINSQNASDYGALNTKSYNGDYIELISSSIYNFTLSANGIQTIPDIEVYSQSKYVEIEKSDNTHFTFKILPCVDNTKIELNIGVKNSSIKTVLKIKTKAEHDVIIDLKEPRDNENLISLSCEGGEKEYTIDLKTQELDTKELYACLYQQDGNEQKQSVISDELKRQRITSSNYYMEFDFDNKTNSITIIPKNPTIIESDDGIKNVFFYLYFFDSLKQYIKRFRICISPCVEEIKFTSTKIEAKAQKSGYVEASTYPNEKAELIWYFTAENPSETYFPRPMLASEVAESLSSINQRIVGKDIKISGASYSSDEYFFATSPASDQKFYYTTFSQAKAMFIVAKPLSQDVFASIPFLISGDSQVILKSEHPLIDRVVPSAGYTTIEEFEDSFITKNLPNGQSYPDTSEGQSGLVRTFYLPHNKISEIKLITEPRNNSVSISASKQSKSIFLASIENLEKDGEYCIEIKPVWQERNEGFLLNSDLPSPAKYISQGQDAYGKNFYQYLGLGVINLSVQNVKIKLRIIIYDGS